MQTEQQRAVTRLCIQCGLFLLQHGAESALVDELSSRLGRALGMDSVESSISSNAIVLTTIKDGQCLTSTRKNHDRGINMHVVTEVQHIVILAEHHLLDYKGVEKRFSQIQPLRYPRWLVALMVGLSCGRLCDGVQRSRSSVTLVCAAWCDRSWFPNDLNDQRVEY